MSAVEPLVIPPEGDCIDPDGHRLAIAEVMSSPYPIAAWCELCGKDGRVKRDTTLVAWWDTDAPDPDPPDAWRTAPCGCRFTGPEPKWRPWACSPDLHWWGWATLLPVQRGGDEFCRRTVVVGWTFTGRLVIPLWHCRGCEACGPENLDGLSSPKTRAQVGRP